MGLAVEQSCSHYDKEIARSSELKNFLFHLSDRAPSAMDELLKSASQRCDQALRAEVEARKAKKRAMSPINHEKDNKRQKIALSTEKDTAFSRQTADSDLCGQKSYNARHLRDDTEPFFVKQESEGNRFEWTEKEANVAGEIVDLTLPPLPDSSNGLVNMDTSPSNSIRKNISTSHEPQTDVQSTLSEQTRSPSRNQEPQEENSNGHHLGTLGFFSGGWGEVPFFTYTSNATEATRSVLRSPEETPLPLPTKIQIESGLTMKTPAIEAFVSAECIKLKLPGIRQGFKIREEIDQILKTVRHLEFYTTRGNLAQYLENREKMPGKKLQALPICDMSNLGGILDALQTVKTNTADNKIHRAYGQKLLYNSVNNNVDKGYKSTVTGRVFTQTAILEELALKKAGPVSKREKHQMISAYLNEYHAGRKWSAVFDSFGGSGMVLVFVIAGIGSHFVEKGWTEFQRHCLDYIAESLSSIKGLVNALGSDALEMYCQKGCLGKTCIDRVKSAKFAEPDGDEDRIGNEDQDDDEEEEEEEDGDGDDDTDTDTDGDEDENAAPEDEDEDKDEDGDGDDST